jgi:hypothetical protein
MQAREGTERRAEGVGGGWGGSWGFYDRSRRSQRPGSPVGAGVPRPTRASLLLIQHY